MAEGDKAARRVKITALFVALAVLFVLSTPEARVAEAFAFVLVWANNVERGKGT